MSSNLSVAEMLAHLQGKIVYHKEQQEEHAKQEAFHAEQRALHEAEHRKVVERFEALQAASAAAGELLVDIKPSPPRPAPVFEEVKSGGWRWIAKLMDRVIQTKTPARSSAPRRSPTRSTSAGARSCATTWIFGAPRPRSAAGPGKA